ncbi:FAD dependent oxidoreductase protein [Rutstroemia sp. NJR-2017a WRK4]|nr:FAD dependent oxidoreductase protein [Rutstroemia sp. NJR-2017a WRK4]PQE11825.1 FAD dependent oxidoreductase protein [Rutstroemia sp. NJR-2017a WRK4]
MGDAGPAMGKQIVIIGGGIIGVSTAYYLTQHHVYNPSIHKIILLEATELAGGSSGRAGGLLASWATPSCLAPLSFKLHSELAEKYDGATKWGYRRVHCADMTFQPPSSSSSQTQADSSPPSIPDSLDWLNKKPITHFTEIGNPTTTAQVDPHPLTHHLASICQSKGVEIIIGASAKSLNHSADGKSLESVTYEQDGEVKTLNATDVVLSAGPWSPRLFPRIPMYGVRSHSIILEPTSDLTPYVLFPIFKPAISCPSSTPKEQEHQEENSSDKEIDALELYPRPAHPGPHTTLYICGPNDYPPLPSSTSSVPVSSSMIEAIKTASALMSPHIKNGRFIKGQACFRPQIRQHADGEAVGPIVGEVDDVKGLWIATGHDEWGVQNSQGTGYILAGMIWGERVEGIDVESLRPKHFIKND